MSVISQSLMRLARSRKALKTAHENNDWSGLREVDAELGKALDGVFDDENRDATELMQEMEKILSIYVDIVSNLPEDASTVLENFPDNKR